MHLFKKSSLAVVLLASSFAAFAENPIPCPPLDAVVAAADILDTVNVTKDEYFPYMVLSLESLKYEQRDWHIITPVKSNNMDTALEYGKAKIRQTYKQFNGEAVNFHPLLMCGYSTPFASPEEVDVMAVSFTFEGKEADLLKQIKFIKGNQKF